jgi:hypothetical protein
VQWKIVTCMPDYVISTRSALGTLRLPWCVDGETLTEPIRISDEPHRLPEALQLRVRDVEDERVQEALGKQVAPDGDLSINKIEAIVADARKAGHLPTVEDSMAFRIGNDLSLMEGCHRTCAMYLLDLPRFELCTRIDPNGYPAYFDSRLKVT